MKEEKFHYGPVEERGRPAVGYIRQLSLSSVCSLLAATERERDTDPSQHTPQPQSQPLSSITVRPSDRREQGLGSRTRQDKTRIKINDLPR